MNDMTVSQALPRSTTARGLAGSTALIVLGMHRSGTSALAGMLHHLGVAFGSRLMQATPDNPRGYWEHLDIANLDHALMAGVGRTWEDVRLLPDDYDGSPAAEQTRRDLAAVLMRDFTASPLWGVKDPRLCRLIGLWRPLLDALGVRARFILTLRRPGEVAASLAARDKLGPARSVLLWLRHVLEAERGTRGLMRAIALYEDLVGGCGWRAVAARLADELSIVWPAADASGEVAVDEFLAPELRRQRDAASADAGALWTWANAVYAAFVSGDEARLRDTCDTVGAEIGRADPVFLPLIAEAANERNQALVQLAQRLVQTEQELQRLRAAPEQGAAPTTADLPAVTPLPVAEAYPRWLASRVSTALAHPEWVAERVALWPFTPRLALGMVVASGNEARVALTLRSLMDQIAGAWELHVAAEAPLPQALAAEQRLIWHCESGSAFEALDCHLAASEADWVALIDAGDQLPPHALFSLAEALLHHPEWGAVYGDEDRIDPQGVRSAPHFKPDFNLDLLRSLPYVGGLLAVRRDLFVEIGGFDARWDGAEDYDLALRLAERLGADGFGHIADILYHRLTNSGRSKRPVAELCADMPRLVQAHLDRAGVMAVTEPGAQPYFCRVHYRHDGPDPLVSIIVPSRDQPLLLKRCVETVLQKTEYQNYEIIVVDNGSTDPEACRYLQNIEGKFTEIGGRIRVLRAPGPFNFSALNNRAVREAAQGDYLCLLNNDAAPLEGAWLSEMMTHARRPEVGVVGAKLLYANGRIQHAGVTLGVGYGAPAEHPFNGEAGDAFGYWGRLQVVQDLSAVTAACLITRRSVWEAMNGLDEDSFAVCYNDVDYCLRVGAAGHLVVWTPFARLLHDGNASLRANVEGKADEQRRDRFARERQAMYRRWAKRIAFDPAYNRNLSSMGLGFAVETEGAPTWDPEFRPRSRVLVYPADREGCGEYRMIAPSRALLASGTIHCYETMRLGTPPEIARITPDAVVLQRQLEWHQIAFIEQLKNTSDTFRVFELDDLITDLPRRSVHRAAIAPDVGERLKKALALCDRLVVSTEPLARVYGHLCAEVRVVPNRLEKSRWLGHAPPRREGGKPRVGWAGAIGHTGDLALIAGVVEATAREVDWVFLGMCPENLRRFVAEYHEWVPLPDYPAKLASLDLDLAIAPLEKHPFNDAKSNLRLLEYGILGYPVLCSDIQPYRCNLPVVRTANRHALWVKAIREMSADRDACRRAGEALRQAVLADWMLEDHLDEWRGAWLP